MKGISKPSPKAPASVVLKSEQAFFAGPLPPPATLSAYESSLPGLAERIVRMAEREQESVLETRRRDSRREDRAQGCAFAVCALLVAGAVASAWLGATAVGCALAGATVVGAMSQFLRRK